MNKKPPVPKKHRTLRADRLLLCLSAVLLFLCAFAAGGMLLYRAVSSLFAAPQNPAAPKSAGTDASIRITATGDILLEEPMLNYFGNGSWQGYMDNLSPWFHQDSLTIANLEVPIGGEELGITGIDFSFNAPAQTAANIKETGIDFVTLANNHAMDRSIEGIINTHANLDAAGLSYTGSYTDPAARDEISIVDCGGIRLAIISYTYNCNQPVAEDWMVNAYYSAWDDRSDRLIQDIEKAKTQADAVIVCMHWGTEFTYQINSEQDVLAQAIADAGADVIIGNHPHCIQPARWLSTPDGRQVLCFYSLGNLASSAYQVDRASETFQNMYEVGAIAQFDLNAHYEQGQDKPQISIISPQIIPIVNHFEQEYQNYRLIPLKDYTEEQAAMHDQARFSDLFSAQYLKDEVRSVFTDPSIPVDLPA